MSDHSANTQHSRRGPDQEDIAGLFGTDGLLAQTLPDFAPRSEQAQMAEAVIAAIANREHLIVEAGTGVGKTFAYLIPALLSGKRVIVSTGTRSLQDQLYGRDLPMLAKSLGRPVRVALLKGRSNYLCIQRLNGAFDRAMQRGTEQAMARQLAQVRAWSESTLKGDIAEMSDLAEDASVWPMVTSTRENCAGADCSFFDRCWVARARREAQAADLVVVNHYLLMADLLLKDQGFGDLLPGADVVIVDEAHQLADVATAALGSSVSTMQVREWLNDMLREERSATMSCPTLGEENERLEQALRAMVLTPGTEATQLERAEWPLHICDGISECIQALQQCVRKIESVAQDVVEIRALRERALDLVMRLTECSNESPNNAAVSWATVGRHGWIFQQALIDVSTPLGKLIADQGGTWIMTSATLSVANKLDYFAKQIGLLSARHCHFGSPFNFQERAILYLPDNIDMPSAPGHTRQVVEAALPLIEANDGGTFMLFTSHRALKQAAALLRDYWGGEPKTLLLVQGEIPRDRLLQAFREHGRAILLGTQSFWEGVDVKGRALTLVVIDKLPFAAPDDPLTRARRQHLELHGGNAFLDEQLPQAVVTLRQGVGRLIRDHEDFGAIMICDRRLLTRGYARHFLSSLPAMPRTSDFAEVKAFLWRHRRSTTEGTS